jgi:hypothetical protein
MRNKNPQYRKNINYNTLHHLLVEGPNLNNKDSDNEQILNQHREYNSTEVIHPRLLAFPAHWLFIYFRCCLTSRHEGFSVGDEYINFEFGRLKAGP